MKLLPCISLLALGFTATGQVFTRAGQIPQFLQPVSYSVPGATMAVLADVNGDGILDIVTANGYPTNALNPGGQGVSLLLGNGDGTFQAARTILATGNPNSVVVGDFNNDGKADIAIANDQANTKVSVLFGNGDGTFQTPISTDIGGLNNPNGIFRGAISLVTADFNGDGKLDLALTSGTARLGMVLLNNGDGTFRTSYTFAGYKVLAADFDSDGKQDLLLYGSGSTLKLGNGDGTFRDGPFNFISAFSANFDAIVGDFNGDGTLDVASVNAPFGRNPAPPNNKMSFGLPGGNFNTGNTNFKTNSSNSVAADFDGDGKLDIAGFHFVDYGIGDGTFSPYGSGAVNFGIGTRAFAVNGEFPPQWVAVGDLDGNGAPDLIAVMAGGVVQVALNTSGHPALLAQLALFDNSLASPTSFPLATSLVGGATTVTGQVWLGGLAPAGGALVTLSSTDPASFPAGSTVMIPAGFQGTAFLISTAAVGASTPVTISATYNRVTLTGHYTVIPASALASISIAPASLFGMYAGDPAVGTVTLTNPAPAGVVISLTSANPAMVAVPATVSVAPGATTATFPLSALHVAADTPVTVSASLQGITRSAVVTVLKNLATVTVTKAQYTASKLTLAVEATSTDNVGYLNVSNANTGAFVGSIYGVGGGKFVGQIRVAGPITSVAVESILGGLAVGAVAQK